MPSSSSSQAQNTGPASMQVQVKGKQIDVGDSLRTHVQRQLSEIVTKYFASPLDATVVFSKEAHLFRADISVHAARGIMLQSASAANDPYPAFDEAAERMAARLRRYKKRLIDTHHQQGSEGKQAVQEAQLSSPYYILNPEKETGQEGSSAHAPLIVAEMTTMIESLTVSEAVMKLDLGDMPALVFKNRAHGGMNVVYRRKDGHVGWVDPANTPEKK